ncbi:hypothetical protein VE02_00786 [Pseudogymnoascus sp. 03VT05]|nr:hypothetical protein VE02_00786 [Pseudogymnoascus sp. 03VT05]
MWAAVPVSLPPTSAIFILLHASMASISHPFPISIVSPQTWLISKATSMSWALDPRLAPGNADLVFGRLLVCGITDWPACISTIKSLLKPKGFVELQDLNNRLYDIDGRRVDEGYEWMRILRSSLAAKGLDPDPRINTKRYIPR